MDSKNPLTRKELRQQEKERKARERTKAQHFQERKKVIIALSVCVGVVALVIGMIFLQQQSLVIVNNTQDPFKGPSDAKVVVAEYADFQCPACASNAPIVSDLMETYGDQVRFEFNDFPLPQHKYAPDAAIAAQCAYQQGSFYELHDVLFAKQREWSSALTHDSVQKTIRTYAEELSLNMEKFDSCLLSPDIVTLIEEDIAEAKKAGVGSTPTFFVNGKRIVDTPFSVNLKKAIDEALAQ